jgi:hypothetical protein
MYETVVELAKEIETWAGSLRYKDNKINEKIDLDAIYHMNNISTGKIIISSDLEHITFALSLFEKAEPAPDHIKNKILLLKAFYDKNDHNEILQ